MPTTVVIGLGSNLGDRQATIEAGMLAIGALPGLEVVARSSLWRTRPIGGPLQPDYYNAAIAVRSAIALEALHAGLLVIEAQFGRVRTERNAPRTLDLDVLWMEGPRIRLSGPESAELVVPHPRLAERAFAMIPLLEVVPDAADPTTGKLYAAILAEVGTAWVEPV